MPITNAVYGVLYEGKKPQDEIVALMKRDLKSEEKQGDITRYRLFLYTKRNPCTQLHRDDSYTPVVGEAGGVGVTGFVLVCSA